VNAASARRAGVNARPGVAIEGRFALENNCLHLRNSLARSRIMLGDASGTVRLSSLPKQPPWGDISHSTGE
jgi:hypothetical protein